MNLNQSSYAIASYKIRIKIDPYVISLNEKIIAVTSNFQNMSRKNDSLLQIKEIVRIYANSKYLDRNV